MCDIHCSVALCAQDLQELQACRIQQLKAAVLLAVFGSNVKGGMPFAVLCPHVRACEQQDSNAIQLPLCTGPVQGGAPVLVLYVAERWLLGEDGVQQVRPAFQSAVEEHLQE